ncbi:MAG: ArsR family transcriptional regulator, lead/cadmium/zinc/bismuth-responsive transcriptional [Pseudonocardiales bacterium]|jgi:DNA-binding transcriptional ArsR family regulator|nr:ArsR family transcriptional regulator, lead/cadmium/zinc/bismuth-responsive transcriptional [Pseudonocardiales bacterium]
MNNRSGIASGPVPAIPDERDIADAADVFGLLADPGRLRLLAALRAGELKVGELAGIIGLSESATSHALRLLRAHRVVEVRRAGRMAYYRLADLHVSQLLDTALAHAGHTELMHPEREGGAR